MTCIVFETPGELDLKAITTFGMNAKPNTKNPIGFFGTGLKYAIAVLVRNQIPVTIFIGQKQYDFYVKDIEFREKGFGIVMYKARQGLMERWRYHELPFTTELGKTWELWQAFREIESNTRDENGRTYHDTADISQHIGKAGFTKIIVGGDAFAQVWAERDKVFLPGGLTTYDSDSNLQIMKQPSNHLYYRGLRVMDLEKPSMFTYNILSRVDLTEDRTLKYPYQASQVIAGYIVRSKDKEMVAKILSTDPEKFYEGRLDFDYVWESPSETFMEIMRKKTQRAAATDRPVSVLPRASSYYSRYAPPPPPTPIPDEQKLWFKLQEMLDSGLMVVPKAEDYDTLREIVSLLKEMNR